MKKILGISLVSVLAVSPMMAHATDVTTKDATGTALTTQAYVKGAYNDLAGHINTKQDKFTAGNAAVNTAVVQSGSVAQTVNAAAVEAASDTALMSEKAVLTAVTKADGAMNARVGALETTVGDSTSGLVKGLADEVSDRETADTAINNKIGAGTISVREATTVVGALNELDTDLGTAESAIRTLNGDATTAGSVAKTVADAVAVEAGRATGVETTLQNAINTLNGDANTNGSVAKAVAAETSRATGVESGLDTRIQAIENVQGDYATKTGVDNAIEKAAYTTELKASTVTGTVSVPTSATISVASSWTEDTSANASVTLNNQNVALANGTVATSTITTSANADYATANPATPANP